ncbi:hypothetical protein Tcan_00875, partial [Toxocara canis]
MRSVYSINTHLMQHDDQSSHQLLSFATVISLCRTFAAFYLNRRANEYPAKPKHHTYFLPVSEDEDRNPWGNSRKVRSSSSVQHESHSTDMVRRRRMRRGGGGANILGFENR